MTNKKLIFMFRVHVPESQYYRYGLKELGRSFEVIPCDLSGIIDGTPPFPGQINPFRTRLEFENFVRGNAGAVFVDYLVGAGDLDLPAAWVFRVLKKYGAEYAVISGGDIPLPGFSPGRLRKLLSPVKTAGFVIKKVLGAARRRGIFFQAPALVFGTYSSALFAARCGCRYIPINSADYDRCLEVSGGAVTAPAGLPSEYAVFVEEALDCAPDFEILGMTPVRPDLYFPSLAVFFEEFEKRSGIPVIVAAHPRSDLERLSAVLGGRRAYKGVTAALIAGSRGVFAHWSTAVSFAVLFSKPVLLLANRAIREASLGHLLDHMSEALGVDTLAIDTPRDLPPGCFDPAAWPSRRYAVYKETYITTAGAPELPVWRILEDELTRGVPGRGGLT